MSRQCPSCGVESPEGARFCPSCGASLAVTPAGGERKVVSVLFADLAGSTSLAERLDAERLDEVMRDLFAEMRGAIEAEGGTVEKFIGDAVMAVFGVPLAHEDDPDRALRAAVEMRARIARLNPDATARYGVPLALRIGLNTGEVVTRVSMEPEAGLVAGDPVNVAARLEAAAAPGQVLVGERTARASRRFRFEPVGPLSVRGKERAVRAYSLIGAAPADGARGVPGLRAPMVGRDGELELLTTLYRRTVAECRPHLVTVYGDPGVGKSRLAREFAVWVEGQDPAPLVVRGRCLPSGEGVTYWPLAEILKGLGGVLDTDEPATALTKLRRLGADRLGPDVAADPTRAAATLAYTVGVDDPETPLRGLPPRQVQTEIKAAWRSLFSALAAESPVVALIEDIHWADPALLDLIEDLAARVQGPVLFLCPSRPELTGRRRGWGGGRRAGSSIALEPLKPDEAARLARLLLEVEDLPEPLHRRIMERAEGNPFFLEEILRQLIDEGRIRRDDGRWRAGADVGRLEIPDSLQAVLAARIDLLEPGDKRVLQCAAVVGRVFWAGPVRMLAGVGEDEVEDALGRLEARDLVVSRLGSSVAGEQEFIFKHVLTRDVAYASLPRRERAAAHERVAARISEATGERRHEFIEILAHHWTEAYRGLADDPAVDAPHLEGVRARAYETSLVAAHDAHCRLALAAAQRLAGGARALAGNASEEAAALEVLGIACLDDFAGDAAWRAYRDAVDVLLDDARDHGERVALLCARAVEIPTRWPGTTMRAVTEAEAAHYLDVGFAHVGDEDTEARIRLLAARAFWEHGFSLSSRISADGRPEREAGEAAAAMAERIGRPDLALAALDAVQSSYLENGFYERAVEVVDRRLGLVDATEDPLEQGDTYAMTAMLFDRIGRYADAAEVGLRGYELTLAALPTVAVHCLSWRALGLFGLGNWDGLLSTLSHMEDLLGDRRDDPASGPAGPWAVAAFVHDARGDRAAADHYLDVIAGIEGGRRVANLSPWVVVALARRGRIDAARRRLEAALVGSHRDARGRLMAARCELIAEDFAWDEAAHAAADARAEITDRAIRTLAPHADRLEGRAALAADDPERALVALGRAATGFAAIDAAWELACTRLGLCEAKRRLGLDGDPELAAALPALEAAGSRRELARAAALTSVR